MDEKERFRLQKIYENELSDKDLIELALTNPDEFEEGVYELVISAVKKRKLDSSIEEIKQIENKQNAEKKWIEIYKFYDEIEKESIEILLREKNIPIDIISRECSAYDGAFRASIGMGVIKVRGDYFEIAKEVIADFEKKGKNEPLSITVEEPSMQNLNKDKPNSSFFTGVIIGLIIGVVSASLFITLTKKAQNMQTSWDVNKDGKIDTWAKYSKGKLVQYIYDQNFDGNPDFWSSYKNDGRNKDEKDSNRDGKIDVIYYYNSFWEIFKVEDDTNYDGKIDQWKYFKDGEAIEFTADNDSDGNIDEWGVFEKGSVKERKWSFKNDEIFDKKALYKNGRKIKEFYDRDRDGSFDEEITLDGFERVIESRKI